MGWTKYTLVGAHFVGHTMDPQFQNADVNVVDVSPNIEPCWRMPWPGRWPSIIDD